MNVTSKIAAIATLAATLTGCGLQNPFDRSTPGESTPAEDDAAIATYTQTVNQASSSENTTVRPSIEVNGNNNVIIVGDGNDPAIAPAPEAVPEEPAAAAEEPAP